MSRLPLGPEALMRVGSGVPFAASNVPFGIPWTEQALGELFFTVSTYAI
jgi:hypothetical protein